MKPRFPLFAKILGWFFLNLLLLVVLGWVFVAQQFRLGFSSILLGAAQDRIEALTEVLVTELRASPPEDWERLLARYSARYGADFLMYRPDGAQIAGTRCALPEEVEKEINKRPAGAPPGPNGPPPEERKRPQFDGSPDFRDGPPPRRGGGPPFDEDRPPRRDGPDDFGPPRGGEGKDQGVPPRLHYPKFVVRSTNPVRYWIGLRVPVLAGPGSRQPVALLIASDSIRVGGLLFDPKPWLILGGGAALVSALFWLPFVRGITRTVRRAQSAAHEIADGQFDGRVDDTRRDELGDLGQSINRMAARLDAQVKGQKRFLGDVAHELCAPIARIQMALGILEERAGESQHAHVEQLREEIQEMSSLVHELLAFSKASLKPKETRLRPVELAELARRVVNREANEMPNVHVQVDPSLRAMADPELLARGVANLVRNAVRYAGTKAGPIAITARREGEDIVFSVSDSGPGVPDKALRQIFDPFYRLEASRSRDTGGIGLGLAIVKTCVEACQGTVSAHNRQPSGLQVDIRLHGC